MGVQPLGLYGPHCVKRNCLGLHLQRLLWRYRFLFISMETTTDTKSIITLSNRANSQPQNALFQHSHHHQLCTFASDEQESACSTCKILNQRRQPTIAVTTAEMHHPPPYCAHIHCLVSINIQQIGEFQWVPFFPQKRIHLHTLLHIHFHVRCCYDYISWLELYWFVRNRRVERLEENWLVNGNSLFSYENWQSL